MDRIHSAELICFDNDGTLFASHEVANPAIQRCFVQFCREAGVAAEPPSDTLILHLTGQPGPVFYRKILPESLRDRADEFRSRCLDEEVREVLVGGRFFDGVETLLSELRRRGRRMVLVTNGGDRYIGAVAKRMAYDRYLDGIYHFGKDGLRRKAEMIRAAMGDLRAARAVMVGDRASDLEAARETGVPFIGCLWGYGDLGEIGTADRLVATASELTELLLSQDV